MRVTVKWHAATHSGTRTVNLEKNEDIEYAIWKVKYWVQCQRFALMYAESYTILEYGETEENDD